MNEDFNLAQQIAELRGLVVAKFDTMEKNFGMANNHLAQLNGKVAAHEKALNEQAGIRKGVQMSWKAFAGATAAVGSVAAVIVTLMQYFIPLFFHK